MECRVCSAATHVLDTRPAGGAAVRRRRECLVCGYRFTTLERTEDELERTIIDFVRSLDPQRVPHG